MRGMKYLFFKNITFKNPFMYPLNLYPPKAI